LCFIVSPCPSRCGKVQIRTDGQVGRTMQCQTQTTWRSGQFDDWPQQPQPPTLTTERRPDGTRNGMDRRTEEPALEEDSPKGSTSDAGAHQLDFTSRRRRTTGLRVTCAIGYATNRDGWSREGGCHGWIRVNRPVRTQPETSRTMRTNPHVNASALRELDR